MRFKGALVLRFASLLHDRAAMGEAALDKDMDRWSEYLFRSHSERTIRSWARRLHFFRFFRAYGGHANDGDALVVAYRYGNSAELLAFFQFLGVELVQHTKAPRGLTSFIPGTDRIEQPGHCSVVGQAAFVWCQEGGIKISLSQLYDVTEAEVCAAEVIERFLQSAPLPRIEPPVDSENCICPKYYPDYFGPDYFD
jgi:hypothetical protein